MHLTSLNPLCRPRFETTAIWLAMPHLTHGLELWMHTLQHCNRRLLQAMQLHMFSHSISGSFPCSANAGDFCSHNIGPD